MIKQNPQHNSTGILPKIVLSALFLFTISVHAESSGYVSTQKAKGVFTLSALGKSPPLILSQKDFPGVIRVAHHLQNDIALVSDVKPEVIFDKIPSSGEAVIIGTLGKNELIDRLVVEKKIPVEDLKNKWETFVIQVVEKPAKGIDRALVIVGSDKRGTIYGMFDLSEKIGVSPFYWWADVPPKKKAAVYIRPGRFTAGEPKVKYRGIFINDEAPALTDWVLENFGNYNSKFYAHVFELILRLKGNFLWPAMWNNAFGDDDPQNVILADEYGIVMSTSHHEPMMRADKEWDRYGEGPWEYSSNPKNLYDFWVEGAERYKNHECIFTMGMRGQQDRPMSEGQNIELLEKIVHDQREILSKVLSDRKLSDVPQVWCLYKEVQAYYEKGMRVPEDITLLWADDNWGNVRRLPLADERNREGRAGVYYHFDYVGGPRNYKWLNTNPLARIWEQMHLAYTYGADRIWLVNVGDIKPMDFSMNFFLDYAWNPGAITAADLPEYTRRWAEKQFGEEHSKEIAELITGYLKFNSRRKPELLSPETYSLVNDREADTVVKEYNDLVERALKVNEALSEESKDAFYELALHPVMACANLNELYVTTAWNRLYAKQGRAATNDLAEKARALFKKDGEITEYYHTKLAGGKWNHMMSQTHIGYTYWQQPETQAMPDVKEIVLPEKAEMGIAVEGSELCWPNDSVSAKLPVFDPFNNQSFYVDVFNRGKTAFDFSAKPEEEWIRISETSGTIGQEKRLWISIDWKKAPKGKSEVPVVISDLSGSQVDVMVAINNPANQGEVKGFVESNGCIAMEAEHFTHAVKTEEADWLVIPDFGRTLSGVTQIPVNAPSQTPGAGSPRLEYAIYTFSEGELAVDVYLAPTLNFLSKPEGIRYAVSVDEETPQIVNMTSNPNPPDLNYDRVWNGWVSQNINIQTTMHQGVKPGRHTLKFWMVDPAVVLEKIVVKTGEPARTYLGPPESMFVK